MNTQRLTLDLDKSSVPRGRVTIAQCDHDGTTVEAEIYDNGIALSTSGLSAYLVMRLPDGRHYYRVPATLDGHVATALVDEAYAATATGTTEIAYFELVGSGGVVYSTSRFGVRVLPSATADATVPETWDGEVERLIQQLDEMAENSREIIDDLTTLEETVSAAERGRVSAESGRVSAETARANAESGRTNAESGRVSAEQGRVVAEQGRVTAESARVSEFATLKAESQAATSAANTAAGNADAAATRANTAANVANAAAANADATADGVESRVQEMAQDAAETATADAEQRIQDAIDAMGDISELAVPLMSKDIRGGAKLEEHGGLMLRDEKLGIGSLVQESDGAVRGGIAGLTAKGHAEQFSTTGKNLCPRFSNASGNGVTYVTNIDGSVHAYGTSTGFINAGPVRIDTSAGITYTISGAANGSSANNYFIRLVCRDVNGTALEIRSGSVSVDVFSSYSFTTPANTAYINVYLSVMANVNLDVTFYPQLELGSTATEYEPYTGGLPSPRPDWEQPIEVVTGHTVTGKTGRFVDLEVRDANDQLLSTTPIPLPSRGWVGSLPDGTPDVLTLDGAGKVTWELKDEEVVLESSMPWQNHDAGGSNNRYAMLNTSIGVPSASEGRKLFSHFVSNGYVWGNASFNSDGWIVVWDYTNVHTLESFKTWLQSNPVTVLYPLATPVTEECGYIDPPSIDGECQISIPELDELGVRYFVDDSAGTLARQWYERAQSEYEGRILALEQAVAELATA